MALLRDATAIVEATEKSGALLQGREILRLGRLLFVLESVATNPALTWPKDLIHYGAQVPSRENLDMAWENLPVFTATTTIAMEA
jgi:DNA processing protein